MNPPTPAFTTADLEGSIAQRRPYVAAQNERRNAIRNDASSFFLNQGLGATVNDFVSHCGITHEYFFAHFASKEEVVGVSICAASKQLQGSLRQLIDDGDLLPIEALRTAILEICRAMNQASLPEGLASEVLVYYPDNHPLYETALSCKHLLLPLLEELCLRSGIVHSVNAARQLFYITESSFLLRHFFGTEESLRRGINAADHLLASFPKREATSR